MKALFRNKKTGETKWSKELLKNPYDFLAYSDTEGGWLHFYKVEYGFCDYHLFSTSCPDWEPVTDFATIINKSR
jgi:hypothetical protein